MDARTGGSVKILLAPHFDDECLFAAYTLLREKPLVVFCFPDVDRHGDPIVRRSESVEALGVLGCTSGEVLRADDLREGLATRFADVEVQHVWAPLPEPDGNSHHNIVGEVASELWPDRVTFYATYTSEGRTTRGERVRRPDAWEALKRDALGCYRSQLAHRGTAAHFERGLDEYLIEAEVCVG